MKSPWLLVGGLLVVAILIYSFQSSCSKIVEGLTNGTPASKKAAATGKWDKGSGAGKAAAPTRAGASSKAAGSRKTAAPEKQIPQQDTAVSASGQGSLQAKPGCTFGCDVIGGNCTNLIEVGNGNYRKLCPPVPKPGIAGAEECIDMEGSRSGQSIPASFTPSSVCASLLMDENGTVVQNQDKTAQFATVRGKNYTVCDYAKTKMQWKASDCKWQGSQGAGADQGGNQPTGAEGPWDNTDYASPDYDDSQTISDGKRDRGSSRRHGSKYSDSYYYHEHDDDSAYDSDYDRDYDRDYDSDYDSDFYHRHHGRKRHWRKRDRERRSQVPGPYKCECKPRGAESSKNLASNANHHHKNKTDIECNCRPDGRPIPSGGDTGSDTGSDYSSGSDDEGGSGCAKDRTSSASRFSQDWPTWSSVTGMFDETGVPPAHSYLLVSPPV
jgi:hypothetical protein